MTTLKQMIVQTRIITSTKEILYKKRIVSSNDDTFHSTITTLNTSVDTSRKIAKTLI